MRVARTDQAALEGRGGDGVEQVMEDSRREAQKETGRVESFSDGVIAIAITLLVLEIKVPKADEIASVGLFAKLLDLWPSFLAFVTSFGTILVMWINHHRVFRLVRTTDYPFLYWNGFLLLTMRGLDEHLVGHALRVRHVDGHADSGEDIQIVGLRRQERLPLEVNRRELYAARVHRLAPGPGVSLFGQTFVFLNRVGKGEDDRPCVEMRHRRDDFAREQFAHRADAYEGVRLEVLNGRDDLGGTRLLGRDD